MSSRSAADIPGDFKTPLALIYRALHKRGVSLAVFLESMAEAEVLSERESIGSMGRTIGYNWVCY